MDDHPFDRLSPDRLRRSGALKWTRHPDDVLPLWVADMDFPTADAIRDAIRAAADEGLFLYPPHEGLPGLREAVAGRLADRYGWSVPEEAVRPLPGIVPGLELAAAAFAGPGEEVLIPSPFYPPFTLATEAAGRVPVHVPMVRDDERGWHYDLDALEAAVTPATRLLMLCHPHNPTGRVATEAELRTLADFALRHRLWVVSDELHADLTLDGRHLPFASLGPEIARRTLTLYGPTKAFNIAGLKVGFAIAENEALLERVRRVGTMRTPAPNVVAQAAARAAYTQPGAEAWLQGTLDYLRGNRDLVVRAVEGLPGVRIDPPQATYLAWLDVRGGGLEAPAAFLLEEAGLALNDGAAYGPGGEGFVRLNFACPRPLLREALGRLERALRGAAESPA